MVLSIWVLNAGQGDSIVIRFPDESWAVVDSNIPPNSSGPPALKILRENNVSSLSFVCLTHPHADHYSGLSQILSYYGGRIDAMWMFNIDSAHVKKFLTIQNQNLATTSDRRKKYAELETIFKFFRKMEKEGSAYRLIGGVTLPPFGAVTIDCLGPLSPDISAYQTQLANSTGPKDYRADENLLSCVLRVRYGSSTMLLSSDAPTRSWPRVWKEARKRKESFIANAVKVSHHGSRQGHHEGIWEKMLAPQGTHGAISSAGNRGHPHLPVLNSLHGLGVRLHCTNFPEHCASRMALDLSKLDGLPGHAKLQILMLDQSSSMPITPCNGDIRFDLSPDGSCTVKHEFEGFCPMHL